MTRNARTRSKVQPYLPGSYDYFRNGTTGHATNSGDMTYQSMHDYVGRPVVPSTLLSDRWDRSGLLPLNGTSGVVGGGGNWKQLVNYIPTGLQNYNPGHASFPTRPPESDAMTTLIARTNPSRPAVTPATLIQDLVEIPRQLKGVGRLFKGRSLLDLREIANQNLAVQFGWLPLVQDVKDVLGLGSYIHRKVGELNRLYGDQGLKRRIHLGYWGDERKTTNLTIMSSYLIVSADIDHFTMSDRWGTVRWKPINSDFPAYRPNDRQIFQKAHQIASGMTDEGTMAGLWDVIPWTWLTDWFGNVGDYLLRYSNTVPAYPTEACVMTRTLTKSRVTIRSINDNNIKGGGGSMEYETLQRYVGSGSVHVHLPMLSVKRLSVLGSLFVQRFLR